MSVVASDSYDLWQVQPVIDFVKGREFNGEG
jgi:hypothetical protein